MSNKESQKNDDTDIVEEAFVNKDNYKSSKPKKKPFEITKNSRLLKCPASECGRLFKEKGNLRTHLRIHSGERPFKCQYENCGRAFITQGNLKSHILYHTDEKLYKCSYLSCNKDFSRLCRLRIHERTHTGVKPYMCPHPNCGKTFNEKGNLKIHYRIHTGEKPFKCSYIGCNRVFKAHGHLKDHIKIHYKIKPFECPVCKAKFSRRSTLKLHSYTHSQITPRFEILNPFDTNSHFNLMNPESDEQISNNNIFSDKKNIEIKSNINKNKEENILINENCFGFYYQKAKEQIKKLDHLNNNYTKVLKKHKEKTIPLLNNNIEALNICNNSIKPNTPSNSSFNTTNTTCCINPLIFNYYTYLLNVFPHIFQKVLDVPLIIYLLNMTKNFNVSIESILSAAFILLMRSNPNPALLKVYLMNYELLSTFVNSDEFVIFKLLLIKQDPNFNFSPTYVVSHQINN